MKTRLKIISGSVLLALSFGTNAAVIDLFSTDQALLTDNTANGSGLSSSVGDGTDATILGGARDIFVELLSTGGNSFAKAEMGVGGGAMSFSVSSQATGTGTVQWDGNDGSIALDHTGLASANIVAGGGINSFKVDTLFSDLGFEFVIEAYTSLTQWTKISFSASNTPVPTTSYIPFTGFTTAALCGTVNPAPGVNSITCAAGNNVVDFSNLGALQLLIDPLGGTTSVDLTLDAVTTVVPEPSTMALLGLGLLGGGLGYRRRRNKES